MRIIRDYIILEFCKVQSVREFCRRHYKAILTLPSRPEPISGYPAQNHVRLRYGMDPMDATDMARDESFKVLVLYTSVMV